VRTLRTKARRDIRRQRAAFAAITLTIFLGVTLFGATYDAFLNLKSSYERALLRQPHGDRRAGSGACRPRPGGARG
jgi:putative ABC transport system permease protein